MSVKPVQRSVHELFNEFDASDVESTDHFTPLDQQLLDLEQSLHTNNNHNGNDQFSIDNVLKSMLDEDNSFLANLNLHHITADIDPVYNNKDTFDSTISHEINDSELDRLIDSDLSDHDNAVWRTIYTTRYHPATSIHSTITAYS